MALYGWDVSTAIIGLVIFDDDGKFISQDYLDLRKIDGQLAKADAFEKWVGQAEVNTRQTNHHFVEERLGGFSAGRTSAQVMMKLAQFNAICSYILWSHNPGCHRSLTYLHPSTWKSLMKRDGLLIPKGSTEKKAITLQFVKRKQPDFVVDLNRNEKPQPWCFDQADAYCIGRAGYYKCIAKESYQLSEDP